MEQQPLKTNISTEHKCEYCAGMMSPTSTASSDEEATVMYLPMVVVNVNPFEPAEHHHQGHSIIQNIECIEHACPHRRPPRSE
ncbi:hypothetical protein Ae201684P_019605 [Aphanomyces euteiches]|nr:hypothetical protein Ae201684P_019605 [Aphanomyces euteiches]